MNLVSIAGCMSCGKTTIAKEISQRLFAPLATEDFEQNPHLEDYYADMRKHSYEMQLWFLNHRIEQINELYKKTRCVNMVQDQMLDAFGFIYPIMQYQNEYMSSSEFAKIILRLENFKRSMENFPSVEIEKEYIVYLRVKEDDVDGLIERIKSRSREFEQELDETYLRNLLLQFEKWYQLGKKDNVLVFDAMKPKEELIEEVTKKLRAKI